MLSSESDSCKTLLNMNGNSFKLVNSPPRTIFVVYFVNAEEFF